MTVDDIKIYLSRQKQRIEAQIKHGQMTPEWKADLRGRLAMIGSLSGHIAQIEANELEESESPKPLGKITLERAFNLEAAQGMFTVRQVFQSSNFQ